VRVSGRAWQLDDKVLQLNPEFAPAYNLAPLGDARGMTEYDLEAALADARKAVELGPNDDTSHFTLGSATIRSKNCGSK
jgi:hypothetical protein